MKIKKIIALLFLLLSVVAVAQQKPVQASIDSVKIKIGSQANLILKTKVDTAVRVRFPEGKNFGQLEVLESYPVDTVKDGAKYELIKKYGLTQFDSGRYTIPRLPVSINNKPFYTDSLKLEVANIKVDTLKQKMFDIKPVMTGESSNTWWIVLLVIVVLAGAGFGVWWYIKKRKKQPKTEEGSFATPIEKATAKLQSLEKKELLQRGEVKDYYSELTDIARTYIEEAIHVPAMESTTTELIEAMRAAVPQRKMSLTQETFEQLERVLRTADMVKFAKSRPMDFEIANDRTSIEKTIVVIDRSIPEEKEEDDLHTRAWEEAQRKKKEKRRHRIIIASSIVGGILVIGGLISFFGMDYLRENYIGYSTKDLLEGQWVKSEYGDPGIMIETPKVLKRQDVSKTLPPNTMALIKDMNMFMYGSLFDDFYVVLSTTKYKKETQVDLNAAVEGYVKIWETQGSKNILLKTETFKTPKGLEGIRSYGTMTIPHSITKQPVRCYYEIFFFKQNGGLQQVVILHREGDEFAPQILEKVKNSIELRNAS